MEEQTSQTVESLLYENDQAPLDLDENSSAGSAEGYDELNDMDCYGIEAIDHACSVLYPDQPNPIQAEAVMKYWLGGPHPLDYISMYINKGDEKLGVPPHWHYVTYGFTDLHGDDRVHSFTGRDMPSGFGFELTFRLKKMEEEQSPPMWPTTLLNKLAAYVFHTGNVLHVGDHIPWHQPLDGSENSRIQHMLVAGEPQLLDIDTPYGIAQFRQIVGVTEEEVKSAQRWKGAGILELLAKDPLVGPYYITDMTRDKSIFDRDPVLVQLVTEGIEKDGSNLGHVTALCAWQNLHDGNTNESQEKSEDLKLKDPVQNRRGSGESENFSSGETAMKFKTGDLKGRGDLVNPESVCADIKENENKELQKIEDDEKSDIFKEINTTLKEGKLVDNEEAEKKTQDIKPSTLDTLRTTDTSSAKTAAAGAESTWNGLEASKTDDEIEEVEEQPTTFVTVDAIQLLFDVEAAELLPLIIKGRLCKGRFFIFHNAEGQAIHFVPPELATQDNVMVTAEEPIKCSGPYLQIFCSTSFMDEVMEEFDFIQDPKKNVLVEAWEIQLKQLPILVRVVPKGGPLEPTEF